MGSCCSCLKNYWAGCFLPTWDYRGCCSFPHGICYSLMGVLMGFGGVFMNMYVLMTCFFQRIKLINPVTGELVAGSERGYGYFARETDYGAPSNYSQCTYYPPDEIDLVFDGWMKSSKAFSFISEILGVTALCVLMTTCCCAYSTTMFERWLLWTYLLAACSIALSFLMFGSTFCQSNHCEVAQGSGWALSTFCFWLVAANSVKSTGEAAPRDDQGDEFDDDDLYYEDDNQAAPYDRRDRDPQSRRPLRGPQHQDSSRRSVFDVSDDDDDDHGQHQHPSSRQPYHHDQEPIEEEKTELGEDDDDFDRRGNADDDYLGGGYDGVEPIDSHYQPQQSSSAAPNDVGYGEPLYLPSSEPDGPFGTATPSSSPPEQSLVLYDGQEGASSSYYDPYMSATEHHNNNSNMMSPTTNYQPSSTRNSTDHGDLLLLNQDPAATTATYGGDRSDPHALDQSGGFYDLDEPIDHHQQPEQRPRVGDIDGPTIT